MPTLAGLGVAGVVQCTGVRQAGVRGLVSRGAPVTPAARSDIVHNKRCRDFTRTKVTVLDFGALNPVVSVQRVDGCGWRSVVVGEEGIRSDELTGGSAPEWVERDFEEDGGAAGSVRDSEGIGAVEVTGAGGAAREDVGVGVDASEDEDEDEVMGGAPDTAEVLEGEMDADVLELFGFRDSDEPKEAVDVAAVADDGGVFGEPRGGLVRVSEEDEASDVPSGLSGSLVTVTQSVMDTVLLLASWILCKSLFVE